MQYSFKKGLAKGLVSVLSMAGAWLAFTGFSDVSIWALLENYLKPVIGSLTVGGLIAMGANYAKIKMKSSI